MCNMPYARGVSVDTREKPPPPPPGARGSQIRCLSAVCPGVLVSCVDSARLRRGWRGLAGYLSVFHLALACRVSFSLARGLKTVPPPSVRVRVRLRV